MRFAAGFELARVTARVPGGLEQPSGQELRIADAARLAREEDEDGLGDVVGELRVADLPKSRGADEAEVALDELAKCRLGVDPDVLAEEVGVGLRGKGSH